MKKIVRNEINKNNMVALSYCQCQRVLNLFGRNYKIGYNSGVYGWNYDLYRVHGVDIVTGYRVPFSECSNKEIKQKLIALDNKIIQKDYTFPEYEKNKKAWLKEFLEIFE